MKFQFPLIPLLLPLLIPFGDGRLFFWPQIDAQISFRKRKRGLTTLTFFHYSARKWDRPTFSHRLLSDIRSVKQGRETILGKFL